MRRSTPCVGRPLRLCHYSIKVVPPCACITMRDCSCRPSQCVATRRPVLVVNDVACHGYCDVIAAFHLIRFRNYLADRLSGNKLCNASELQRTNRSQATTSCTPRFLKTHPSRQYAAQELATCRHMRELSISPSCFRALEVLPSSCISAALAHQWIDIPP